MEKEISAFTIYGNAVRGSNSNRHSFAHAWHNFLREYGHNKVDKVYALYYNYVSDYTDEFDFVIGMTPNDGKPAHNINGGKYYVWDVGTEDPMDVPDAWEAIWQSDINRAYTTDFEVYVPGESTKIYLALK